MLIRVSAQSAIHEVREAIQLPSDSNRHVPVATPLPGDFPIYSDMSVLPESAVGTARAILLSLGYDAQVGLLESASWIQGQRARLKTSQRVFASACLRAVGKDVLPALTNVDTCGLGVLFTAESLAIAAILGIRGRTKDPAIGFSPDDVIAIMRQHPTCKVTKVKGALLRSSTNREGARRLLGMPTRASRRPNKSW